MLTFEEYDRLDALEMARLVRDKQLSAADLTEAAIARAQTVNTAVNAIVTPLYEQARTRAAQPVGGPLAGVPFLVKDFGSRLAGAVHTSGSRALRNYVPTADDDLIRRWKAAGLNILGKTNTPEFALMGITEPELHGPTRTPWDLTRTSGGSSGGSGAAVAAGIVPVAGAGDGGGSIRIPASCCGIFGLKPSRGRVTSGPLEGELWYGAAVEHALTRSVRDSAALLDLECVPEVGAPFQIPPPQRPFVEEVGLEPGKLRIGFSAAHPLGGTVHPDVVTAVQDAAKLLESLGHDVQEVSLPWDGPALARDYFMMYFADTGAVLAGLQEYLGRPARASDVEGVTWLLGQMGRAFTAAEFAASLQRWNTYTRSLGRFHEQHDLLLIPTLAVPPMRIGELAQQGSEKTMLAVAARINVGPLARRLGVMDQMATEALKHTPFTQLANLTGRPAMSVPLHWSPDGLPIGVQFVARFAREDTLFRLAGQLERARPWFGKCPPLK